MVEERKSITPGTYSRNYGIDLLRIVAASYIIFIHAIGQGGVLSNLQEGTLPYSIMWALQIVGNSGVDIFILISGYTSISKNERNDYWSKPILLWLEVLYYNVLIYLIWNLTHGLPVIPQELLKTFFPVTNTTYWYLSIFIGFSAVKPILDRGIREMDEKHLKQVFVVLFMMFIIYPVFYGGFGIIDGFSVIWFIVLYSLAAIAKKSRIGENLSTTDISAMMFGLLAITWLWKMYGFTFSVLGKTIDNSILLPYASPTIAGIAFLHILLFSRFNPSHNFSKLIQFAAPSAFAVYIMNTHPSYWSNVLKNQFAPVAIRRFSVYFPRVLIYVFSFVIIAVLIDKIRQYIFRKTAVAKKIENVLSHFQ